jgi:protein gp37
MSTKIEWCNMTWNPVMGCKTECPYCYAKKINDRFNYIKNWNDPEWRETGFNKKFPHKPSRIFVNSMSDIAYWKPEWMQSVLDKIKEYPQHTFLFLTKSPKIYNDFYFKENCWLGITITNQKQMSKFENNPLNISLDDKYKLFLSIEPMQEQIELSVVPDWIIIGAETGNRKNKIIPKKEWIEEIIEHCKYINIPIFMKNNLASVWRDKLIQEYPK